MSHMETCHPHSLASPLFKQLCVPSHSHTLTLSHSHTLALSHFQQLKEDVRYLVSVTLAKGDRSATASRSITPTSGNRQGLSAQVRGYMSSGMLVSLCSTIMCA